VSGRPELGDKLFVAVGYPVPNLLRALDKLTHLYKLVGQCYMYALIEGEIFNVSMGATPQGIKIK
jgi:hypothetical protein